VENEDEDGEGENEDEDGEGENAMEGDEDNEDEEGDEDNEDEEGEGSGRRTSSYCDRAACQPGYAGAHFPCFTGTVLAYWYSSTNTDT
jgi:hypothetical protein